MVQPIVFTYDLGFRIGARYGLDFFLTEHEIIEQGEYNPEEREASYPEQSMWGQIVPEDLRKLLQGFWGLREPPVIPAVPEELLCALIYKRVVYLNARDFVVARGLDGFRPLLDRAALKQGHVGAFAWDGGETDIFVSREIPEGYYCRKEEPIEGLNWQPPPGPVRVLKPLLSAEIETEVQLGLQPFKVDSYLLNDFRRPRRVEKA